MRMGETGNWDKKDRIKTISQKKGGEEKEVKWTLWFHKENAPLPGMD